MIDEREWCNREAVETADALCQLGASDRQIVTEYIKILYRK